MIPELPQSPVVKDRFGSEGRVVRQTVDKRGSTNGRIGQERITIKASIVKDRGPARVACALTLY